MTFAARNFTFNFDQWKTYCYPIEYIRAIERVSVLRNNISEHVATDRIAYQSGSNTTDSHGRNVISPPYIMKGFKKGCFRRPEGSGFVDDYSLNKEAYIQELKARGFIDIGTEPGSSNLGHPAREVSICVQNSTTSASYCNDGTFWQSQFKLVNNSNTYVLMYEGYNTRPFYISGRFNVSYMATSYTEKRLVYYGTSQPDDVEIKIGGVNTVNEVYDFSDWYLHDLPHNIRTHASSNGALIDKDCSHSHSRGSFLVLPDVSLNPNHGNLTYRATDSYRHLESKRYGGETVTEDNFLYQTSMLIGLTQALSQKWPQQLYTPTLPNCFYTVYTPDGSFYSHGLMPTIHDVNNGFDFICNPLFSTKIKLSNDRGVLHIGGFFSNNRQAVFTENNIALPTFVDNISSDILPTGYSGGSNQFAAHFTGKIILASGGVYKGQRIPFKQESSKYIYVFDNSVMSFKVIGELPTPLFGCSTFTLSDTEFLVFGGISRCPTARIDWENIIPSNAVYKITLNSDLTLKSVSRLPDSKYGHFFAGITTVNDRLFIASGTNYELYDIKIGPLKSGQIKSPRYGCYIQKYITGEGYDQYALIGGWKHTSISGTNSICPIRYVGLSNLQRIEYNNALARNTEWTDYTDFNLHTSKLEPESLSGYYMPDLDFITDGNFALKYESNSEFNLAIYEDGTTSGSPNNISWNDKIEIISGLETIKDGIPSFTVDKKSGEYGDQLTFTLPPPSFYSPGDKVTVTYIDDFNSNYENSNYSGDPQLNICTTYSRTVVHKEIHIYRLYKGDGSTIYEKQITIDTYTESLNLTTSVEYPAIASEYVLTPTFSSSYDGDVYLVKAVHPEVKILLGKDKSGIGITMKTEVDSAPYLGWYLRIVRPNGVIREISNTYVSNIVIPTTFTVIAPSNYNSSDGILIGTEFTLQFDCPSGQLKNALFVNLNDSNTPKIPITIGTPFKYTPTTSGYVTYHIECKTLDGAKTISSDSIVLNTFDPPTTISLEVISPAGYAGEDVDNGTVFTLRLNCTNPAITTGRIGIQNPPQDEVYMDVNTNTPFTYTPPDYSSTTLTGEVINNGTTIYTNYINTYVTGPTIELGLTIISPSGYDNDDLNDVLNGTEFTIRCDATIPNGMSLSQPITLTGGTIENGWIQGIIGGDKTITTGTPFTLSIENNNTTQIWVSSTDNLGNQVVSNARNLKSVSTQETKILLTIAAPANCIYGGDIQNGTELMFKLLAREVNGVTITNPVLTGTKYESGQQVNITPIPITVGTLLAYIPTANTQSQLWISAQLSTGGNIVSNTMYVNMREQNSDHS